MGQFGRIVEEYWVDDWASVEKDFRQMRDLGANVVRLHLQVGTYFGHSIEEHAAGAEPSGQLVAKFLAYWQEKGRAVQRDKKRESRLPPR